MANYNLASRLTSNDLEKEILARFRQNVGILPPLCDLHRERGADRIVLCLNFADCEYQLEIIKEKASILLTHLELLRLGKSIIFRVGNQTKAFRHLVTR